MSDSAIVGSIVTGSFDQIVIRQKAGQNLELGDLVVSEDNAGNRIVLQIYELEYGSSLTDKKLEQISGLKLERLEDVELYEKEMRNYTLALAKPILIISGNSIRIPKSLPPFFGNVRRIEERDIKFARPSIPIYLGKLRSGSKVLETEFYIDGSQVFRHHVLIPASTGKGKSNLLKVMLWSVLDHSDIGVLVLDTHDEYYGRHEKGLKDHPYAKERLVYYSPSPVPGSPSLIVNIRSIKPNYLTGIIELTDAQQEAIWMYYNRYREKWIESIFTEEIPEEIKPTTIAVIRRKLENLLGIHYKDNKLKFGNNIFNNEIGETTIDDIVSALENGKVVLVDTSYLSDKAELLIGSIIASSIFEKYQSYKLEGKLELKPTVAIAVEEAPRILGKDKIEKGDNIYSTIAREGRKFKVGLIAVTQITSVIPRDILANMNTKIILGNELINERQAIIESAAQDLSEDDRNIASLDIGEAIVSSTFTKFAVPIKIPEFNELVAKVTPAKSKYKTGFV